MGAGVERSFERPEKEKTFSSTFYTSRGATDE